MGVLNVTPDSFSDGGQYISKSEAIRQANLMTSQGATIIDIGGESTRPGASPVSLDEELNRVLPVIEAIRSTSDILISIDTSKAEVMKQAVDAGASIVNDVYGLRQPGALEAVAALQVPICLMHMQLEPETMQLSPQYNNVIDDVKSFFEERINACEKVGISRSKIILDPGFGFGKKLEHNLELLANLSEFKSLGCPILVGLSRKSMFGDLLGKPVSERTSASVVAAIIAITNGASVVRVHDVEETSEALKIYNAVQQGNLR
jgi:dihydropteroate synthase